MKNFMVEYVKTNGLDVAITKTTFESSEDIEVIKIL